MRNSVYMEFCWLCIDSIHKWQPISYYPFDLAQICLNFVRPNKASNSKDFHSNERIVFQLNLLVFFVSSCLASVISQ